MGGPTDRGELLWTWALARDAIDRGMLNLEKPVRPSRWSPPCHHCA